MDPFSLLGVIAPHSPSHVTEDLPNATRGAHPLGKVPHICIVGAGIAGLRCAEVLIKKGLKVTILEARNRIGGRVR